MSVWENERVREWESESGRVKMIERVREWDREIERDKVGYESVSKSV